MGTLAQHEASLDTFDSLNGINQKALNFVSFTGAIPLSKKSTVINNKASSKSAQ